MRQYKSYENGTTVAVIGSMTAALGAQRALALAAVHAQVVKQDAGGGATKSSGCTYGISFPSSQKSNVSAILSHANIRVRGYAESGWQTI